jgi:hypothetical protein
MKGFVIDTDSYAGNFERELCAYITGVVGDCGVGSRKIEFDEIEGVAQVADDNGCYRPCAIYETPGYFNNGMGYHYKAGDESNALQAYKDSVIADQEKWIAQEEGLRGQNAPTWTDEAIDNSIARRNQKIKEIKELTRVNPWPAYQSVIIYFEDKHLTPEVIKLMKTRANDYDGKFNIEGFRIATITTTVEEVAV